MYQFIAKALKHAFPMHKDYLKILSLAYFEDEGDDMDTQGMVDDFDDIKMINLGDDLI